MTLTVSTSIPKKTGAPGDSLRASVVIPVRNGAHHLRRTLPVLRDALPPDWEIIVVDDNSSDGSPEVARLHADTVIKNPDTKSAPAARNVGAGSARGAVLVFLDADVRVTRRALLDLVLALEQPGTACTFGVYSEGAHLATLGGRFKNIWVRYSYLKSPARVRWMNTAMAAIRAADFRSMGGFDNQDDWLEGGNDMDFGRRVDEQMGSVILLHDVACDHLKELSLGGLLRNDFFRTRGFFRTALFSKEIRRAPGRGYGNISPGFIGGVLAAAGVPLALSLSIVSPPLLWLAVVSLGFHGLLGAGFYAYAVPRLGRSGWTVPPILLCVHLACAAGLAVEALSLAAWRLRGRRFTPAATAPDPAGNPTDVVPAARA